MPAWCFGMTNAQTFIDSHRDELRSALRLNFDLWESGDSNSRLVEMNGWTPEGRDVTCGVATPHPVATEGGNLTHLLWQAIDVAFPGANVEFAPLTFGAWPGVRIALHWPSRARPLRFPVADR